ncbi:hypothetical protein [Photobacterium iliopiscarium]|uniref:hypothetical protein n=1 Tax=Photobacterium iliopiscarium TaxID=56192 RepID=UPI001E573819|nr:hypothetical protein [Photobacterium iliopiscarium]MCD9468559.1 hypothetical protein [Photobacterium iliopiscarium]MCD9488579.1 hypothetical protein [Photobacterium iliopiscarium]MCF2245290.1 hypothetical protein [Photobacterium iliopiscarium]
MKILVNKFMCQNIKLDNTCKKAIDDYFNAIDKLKKLGIVRSKNTVGDIGEFLCTVAYPELRLDSKKTTEGYDAILDEKKIQIKYRNSQDGNNIDLGFPEKYNEIIVVLGIDSAHRMIGDSDEDFLFYRFTSQEVKDHMVMPSGKKYSLSKTKHIRPAEKTMS